VTFQKDFEHKTGWGVDLQWILAKPFWRHGFKEVVSCSGMEENYCDFNYRKKERCLFVGTAGVYPGSVSVRGWSTYPVPVKGRCSSDAARTAYDHFPHTTVIHGVP